MADETTKGAPAPAFSIRANGSDIPIEARGSVIEIVVEESLDQASTFALELSNWDMARQKVTWSDSDLFAPGGAVEIALGYDDKPTTVLRGEITGLVLSFPEHLRSLLVVRGFDRLHRLRRGRKSKTYTQVKDSDIASAIAGDVGLTADVEDSGEVYPHVFQVNQTDLDFLLARAMRIGYEVLVDDKTLRFRKVKNDRGKTKTYSTAKNIVGFHAYLSTANQVSEVTVRGWDPKAKQELVGRAQTSDVNGTMGGSKSGPQATDDLFGTRRLVVVERPVFTQNEADVLARGILNKLALDYVTAECTLLGDPDVRPGSVLELDGLGTRFSGLYHVTSVRHVLGGSFLTHVEARRNST